MTKHKNKKSNKLAYTAIFLSLIFGMLAFLPDIFGYNINNDTTGLHNFISTIFCLVVCFCLLAVGLYSLGNNRDGTKSSKISTIATYIIGIFLCFGVPILFLIFTDSIWNGLLIYFLTVPAGIFILDSEVSK